MKTLYLIFLLVLTIVKTKTYAQEPRISYCFKVFVKSHEVTDSSKNYKLESLPRKEHLKTVDDRVLYARWDCFGACPLNNHWQVKQEYANIRDYLWIRITEVEKKITMNIFLLKKSKYSFYGNAQSEPCMFDGKSFQVDSVVFQRGNFVIVNRPKFIDWKKKSSENIIKVKGNLEMYIEKEFDRNNDKEE